MRRKSDGTCVGFKEQRRRMGRWKARVEVVTSRRKKRYWRISGWVWRRTLFEGGWLETFRVVEVFWAREECGVSTAGRLSFSMRAQVR